VALENFSEKLTPAQIDYCAYQLPSAGLRYCGDKLTPERFDYCVLEAPRTALELYPEKLTDEQLDYCLEMAEWEWPRSK
jgi:hypothetical protein